MITAFLGLYSELPRVGFSFKVPQGWGELSQRQIAAILPLIVVPQSRLFLEARLVMILLDVRWWQIHTIIYLKLLPAAQKLRLHELVKWVYERQPRFEDNPFPCLKLKGRAVYGPLKYLRHVRTLEFFMALKAVNKYRDTRNIKYLRELAAHIYRPAKADIDRQSPEWDGDVRQKYNQHVSEAMMAEMAHLPPAVLYAVQIYFETALPVITKPYPFLFPPSGGSGGAKSGKDNTAK
jgi:hypothetical protein